MNKTAQLAWCAGFLEGDGCFSCSNTCPNVVAVQKSREPLDRLQEYLGCGNIYRVRDGQYWTWNLYGINAVSVMFTLYSMLSKRRQEKIRDVVGIWSDMAPGRGGANRAKTHCPQGHPYSGDNVIVYEGKKGRHRYCLACRDIKNARNRKKVA